jgi:hypothetical protein
MKNQCNMSLPTDCNIVKGAQTTFGENHGLLTQAHKLTKSRRSLILYLSLF